MEEIKKDNSASEFIEISEENEDLDKGEEYLTLIRKKLGAEAIVLSAAQARELGDEIEKEKEKQRIPEFLEKSSSAIGEIHELISCAIKKGETNIEIVKEVGALDNSYCQLEMKEYFEAVGYKFRLTKIPSGGLGEFHIVISWGEIE